MKIKKGLLTLLLAYFSVSGFTVLAEDLQNQEGILPPFEKAQSTNAVPKNLKGNTGVNYTSKEQETILQLQRVYQNLDNNQLPEMKYLEQPLIGSSGYKLGLLNRETVENATKNLNYYRQIAGMPELASFDEHETFSQYASIGMAATRDQSHGLTQSVKPSNMPNDFWTNGVQYTQDSVLHSAYLERSLNDHTKAYLADYGAGNKQVGHRAWLLSHQMARIGFGYAPSENPTSTTSANYYTAMYIRDRENKLTPKERITTWPSEGVFPTNLMQNMDRPEESLRWSIHLNTAGYQVSNQITITMTNTQTQEGWSFSETNSDGDFLISPNKSGGYSTVMFQPGTDNKPFIPKVGDLFSVEIKGLTGVATSYQYTVRLFDVTEKLAEVPVESIDLSTDKTVWPIGETGTLQATVSPDNATDKSLIWSSSDEKVATVDQTGKVTALSKGEVTISAHSLSGNVTQSLSLKTGIDIKAEKVGYLLNNYGNIPVGGTVQINGYITSPYNASNQAINYRVRPSDEGKIEVSETGVVTGTITGKYYIDILSADGGAKNQVGISVGSGHWFPEGFDFPTYLGGTPQTPIPVTGVQLNQTDLRGGIGSTWTLTSEVFPIEASNPYRRYRSSNPTIVNIPNPDKGELIAKQKGVVMITVFTADGLYEDSLQVTVQ